MVPKGLVVLEEAGLLSLLLETFFFIYLLIIKVKIRGMCNTVYRMDSKSNRTDLTLVPIEVWDILVAKKLIFMQKCRETFCVCEVVITLQQQS